MTGTAPPRRPRAQTAADAIAALAADLPPGARIGSRTELRERCGVSVGTLHEALRMLQATGEVAVRTGPGGGVFRGEATALARLLREAPSGPASYPEVARVLDALGPLLVDDALASLDGEGRELLRSRLASLRGAAACDLPGTVRASLELFSTIVQLPPGGVLATVAGAVLRTQSELLADVAGPVDPQWRGSVDRHVAAAGDLVAALLAGDRDAAVAARGRPGFRELFERVSAGFG